jgi:hypothetical protein
MIMIKQEELKKINDRLKNLQDKLLAEAVTLDKELLKRVQDVDDPLDDYEIELVISFFLKEDDLEYKEDEDNILTSIQEHLKGISAKYPKYPWLSEDNHNEFRDRKNHIMKDEYHCWWYHCLYDHTHLDFKDILRIGLIWSDIKVEYQYFDEA